MSLEFDIKSIKEKLTTLEELRDFQKKSAKDFENSEDFYNASEVRLKLIKTEKNIDIAKKSLNQLEEKLKNERIEHKKQKEENYKILKEFDDN